MPPIDLYALFDPEIILPSEESAQRLEFWLRLQEWTEDPRPRMGPLTSVGLQELMANPPSVTGLPPAEFWKIVGKLVSRSGVYIHHSKAVCEVHTRAAYAPCFGRSDNVEALIDALSNVPQDFGVALATDSRCWSGEICEPSCGICQGRVIDSYTQPRAAIGHVWRRQFLQVASDRLDILRETSSDMFPSLRFSEVAWNHLNTLSGDVRDIARKLVLHLSVLNDHVAAIWNSYTATTDRQSQLGGLGVLASPENANTRRSNTAMKARTFEFGDEAIRCEWHTKLHPNRDRIYFAVLDGQVYVGSIIEHL